MRSLKAMRGYRARRVPYPIRRLSVPAIVSHYALMAAVAHIHLLSAREALIAEKAECVRLILELRRLRRRIVVASAVGLMAATAYLCLRLWA